MLALLIPVMLAASLAACRRAPDGQPVNSLVVGIDVLTDSPYNTEPPETSGQDTPSDTTSPWQGDVTDRPVDTDTRPVTEETTQEVDVVSYDYEVEMTDEVIAEVGSMKSRKLLRYPRLTGLSNADMQTKINELLAEIAASEYKNRLMGLEEYTKNGVTVKYEITDSTVTYLGGNLLSVRSAGSLSYSDGTPELRFMYSNVINLSTGKNVSQKKLYTGFGDIKKLFEDGKFTQISGAEDLTSSISLADMMTQYSLYELYNTYPETYFTPEMLIISIELNAKLGGYAEFSIPLSEVNGYLSMSPTK